jgi:hypothetical protein
MTRFLVGKYNNALQPSWIVKADENSPFYQMDRYHIFASFCYPWTYSRQDIISTAERFGLSESDLEFLS